MVHACRGHAEGEIACIEKSLHAHAAREHGTRHMNQGLTDSGCCAQPVVNQGLGYWAQPVPKS